MRRVLLAFLLVAPMCLCAQGRVVTSPPIVARVPTTTLAAAGVAGMGVGLLAGAGIGLAAGGKGCSSHSDGPNLCGAGMALVGAGIGESVGTAFGVNLANHARGSVAYSALATLGIAAAGIAASSQTRSSARGPLWLVVPVAQIAAAIAIERASDHPRPAADVGGR